MSDKLYLLLKLISVFPWFQLLSNVMVYWRLSVVTFLQYSLVGQMINHRSMITLVSDNDRDRGSCGARFPLHLFSIFCFSHRRGNPLKGEGWAATSASAKRGVGMMMIGVVRGMSKSLSVHPPGKGTRASLAFWWHCSYLLILRRASFDWF